MVGDQSTYGMISNDCARWASLEIPVGLPCMAKKRIARDPRAWQVDFASHVRFLHSSCIMRRNNLKI